MSTFSSINTSSSQQQLNSYIPSSFNYAQREKELLNTVTDLYKKTSPQINIKGVRVNSFNQNACLDTRYSYSINWQYPFFHIIQPPSEIVLPASYYFKSEDIPSHFQIQDFNDPRLNDEQFLRSFSEWVNSVVQHINISEQENPLPLINAPKNHSDFMQLQLFLMFLRDPILFEKMKKHIIAHELCHGLDENQSHFLFLQGTLENAPAIGTLSGLAICGLGFVLTPFVSLPIALSVAGSGMALSAATIALSRLGFSKCCEIEKKCDLGAIDALKDASGAIYEFETMRQIHLLQKTKNPSLPIDDNGNNVYDVKHPRLTSRISYCQQWQDKNI